MAEIEIGRPQETSESPRLNDADSLDQIPLTSSSQASKAWLRVYLGYAPGVGKTYAMLKEGRLRRSRGTDVVIGWVEAYGRPRAMEAAGELEIVPPRTITYRGVPVREMDVEAITARRPQLALVDELAHTNVPGSKNAKRYEDVFELQANGINVISTMNVQHLSSLRDTISLLTGVTVTETLPDWIIDTADDLDMVDQPPRTLRRRLRRGSIYPRQQVDDALNHFFREDNLTVLRELTLRRIAAHADRTLDAYRRSRGLERPQPPAATVLVCVPPNTEAQRLVRRGLHLADRLHARLVALHVTQPRRGLHPETSRGYQEAARALQLARALGAEVVTVAANNVADAIVRQASELGASQIIIGESTRLWPRELFHASVVRGVLRRTKNVDVYVARRGE